MSEEKPTPAPSKPASTEWQHASLVSAIGKWAWIVGVINGIIYIIIGFASIIPLLLLLPWSAGAMGYPVWNIIGGVLIILLSLTIIRPKVSNKCAEKDWDHFHSWVWNLGGFKFPFVLFWGIILEIIGSWWGGIPVLIVAFLVIFMGPKEYQWSE